MMPVEWPVAAGSPDRTAPAPAAGRSRLSTVRVDFFLDPAERLSEQERALMSAMLHWLIADVASEIRAVLPSGYVGANDEDEALVASLTDARLLDDPDLIGLLLRRAEEERIASAAGSRARRGDARAIQGLVSHESAEVSAAAMALILARGRRRDRFGQSLVAFDDLSSDSAEHLAQSVAAALRHEIAGVHGASAADRELSNAAAQLIARHDPSRGVETLMEALVATLDRLGGLDEELLLACAQQGEIAFIEEVLARRSGIPAPVAFDELLSGDPRRLMAVLRVAGLSRDFSAGLLGSIGDLLGIGDPGAAIDLFDAMSPGEVQGASTWLTTGSSYRAAIQSLGSTSG